MENCEMNLRELGYQADINSRSNISAVVLRLPKYLRSEWAKEAQNSRDQGREPDFSQLTKFVVKRAKLVNTEYGRLINTKPENERPRGKNERSSGHPRKVSSYASSGNVKDSSSTGAGRANNGKSSVKLKCYFCDKEGHTVERCFKFREKSYEERRVSCPSKDCVIFAFRRDISLANARKSMDASSLDVGKNIIQCSIL